MMKKRTTLVALVLAAILLCAALASCDMAEDVKDGFDESMKVASTEKDALIPGS